MFPDGDTKPASSTTAGEADTEGVAGEGSGGASPRAAFVATTGVVGRGSGVPDDPEHAVKAATRVITPPSPAQPRAAAISPPQRRNDRGVEQDK